MTIDNIADDGKKVRLINANTIPWEEHYVPDGDVMWEYKKELCVCKSVVDEMPTMDSATAIRGTWEIECKNRRRCSHCGFGRNTETQLGWNYCPNCGSQNGW